MPARYEAMRDKFAKGARKDSAAYNRAQTKAAKIYNATRKRGEPPLSGHMKEMKRHGL